MGSLSNKLLDFCFQAVIVRKDNDIRSRTCVQHYAKINITPAQLEHEMATDKVLLLLSFRYSARIGGEVS